MTERYRRVNVSLWYSEPFLRLSGEAAMLLFRLMTGPESGALPGVIVTSREHQAVVAGWNLRRFNKLFAELEDAGLAKADWSRQTVVLPTVLKVAVPATGNVIKAWASHILTVPPGDLKNEVIAHLEGLSATLGPKLAAVAAEFFRPPYGERIDETLSRKGCENLKPYRNRSRSRSRSRERNSEARCEVVDGRTAVAADTPPDSLSLNCPTGNGAFSVDENAVERGGGGAVPDDVALLPASQRPEYQRFEKLFLSPLRSLPANWTPSAVTIEAIRGMDISALGLSGRDELAMFKAHARTKSKTSADWDAELLLWVHRSVAYAKRAIKMQPAEPPVRTWEDVQAEQEAFG